MKFKISIIALVGLLLLTGCAQSIDSVKNQDNIGKKVSVKGDVTETIKIGGLSGYIVEDETGSISVSSEELPAEGDTVRVSGTLIRDTIFGYYIKT